MTDGELRNKLTVIGCAFEENQPYSKVGYWKIGGSLRWFVHVATVQQLTDVVALGLPILLLGNGSNMLLSDAGFAGLSIQLTGDFDAVEFTETGVVVGAGVANVKVLSKIKREGRGGLGALAGVPGTVGGAIRMNAGTYLGEIGAVVDWVEWMNNGVVHRSTAAELNFQYRRVDLPWSAIVLRTHLLTHTNNVDEERASIKKHLARRKETQPLHLPSCGSVFKNPEGDYAGRLIEQVGLKGHQIGNAQISEKHANFIVNLGGATAHDVAVLIRLARASVYRETGVALEPEVRREGPWDDAVWALSHELNVNASLIHRK